MKSVSILIVDDQEADRYILKRFLQKTDTLADILEVEDGRKALDLLEKNERENILSDSTIIFLDINMPVLNGFEFLKFFSIMRKRTLNLQSCSIIILTSSLNPEDREIALSYNFVNGFINKGKLSHKELNIKITQLITERN